MLYLKARDASVLKITARAHVHLHEVGKPTLNEVSSSNTPYRSRLSKVFKGATCNELIFSHTYTGLR